MQRQRTEKEYSGLLDSVSCSCCKLYVHIIYTPINNLSSVFWNVWAYVCAVVLVIVSVEPTVSCILYLVCSIMSLIGNSS